MRNNKLTGFTITELLITLAVASIVMAIGIPSFTELLNRNRLTASTNQLITDLNLARSEAVKRGRQVVVRKVGANGWEEGWEIFADVSRNGANANVFNDNGDEILCEPNEDCLLRQSPALALGFTLRGNNNFTNFVRYGPDGTSNTIGSFAVCDNQDGKGNLSLKSKLIIINRMGRIRLGSDDNHHHIPEKEDGNEITNCINGF